MKLLYFAAIRSRVGIGEETVAVPPGIRTVADLLAWQRDRGAAFADAFRDLQVVRVAVNEEYAQAGHPVRDGDEVAFFPPVTGG